MTWNEWAVTIDHFLSLLALPLAVLAGLVLLYARRRQHRHKAEDVYQRISGEYTGFLKLVLNNPDLKLLRKDAPAQPLSDEQNERKLALFNILVSLFERAYILLFEETMPRQQRRLWLSVEDYIREWCRRPDFREALPELLQGEDEDFQAYIRKISEVESLKSG